MIDTKRFIKRREEQRKRQEEKKAAKTPIEPDTYEQAIDYALSKEGYKELKARANQRRHTLSPGQLALQAANPNRVFNPRTAERVTDLAALGCTHAEIGSLIGMPGTLVQRLYAPQIDHGMAALKTSLRRWQVKKARQGNVQMLIWLGKQLLGQRDKHDILRLTPDDLDIVTTRIKESLAFYSNLSTNMRQSYGIGLSQLQIAEVVIGGFSEELRPVVQQTLARLFPLIDDDQLAAEPASLPAPEPEEGNQEPDDTDDLPEQPEEETAKTAKTPPAKTAGMPENPPAVSIPLLNISQPGSPPISSAEPASYIDWQPEPETSSSTDPSPTK